MADAFSGHIWKGLEGRRFYVWYTSETQNLARPALDVAEKIGDTLAAYFGADFIGTKISIVLQDDAEFSNGYAYEVLPLIAIECRKTDILFRSQRSCLTTAISHELSHVLSLRVLRMPLYWSISAEYFSEKRGEKDYAEVDLISKSIPGWFIEGIAQEGSAAVKADFRDPYREALLRDAYIHNTLLSLDRMARFEGTSRDYELLYNQGFDFLDYLQIAYPARSLRSLCGAIAKGGFRHAVDSIYNSPLDSLYTSWKKNCAARFGNQDTAKDLLPLFPQRRGAFVIESDCQDDYCISNGNSDFEQYDLCSVKGMRRIRRDVGQRLAKDRNTGEIYFAGENYSYSRGYAGFDLYRIASSKRIRRITYNARCMQFAALNGNIAYASFRNGATSLIVNNNRGRADTLITFGPDTAIDYLSFFNDTLLLVSIAEPKGYRAALLSKRKLDRFAPDSQCDVRQLQYFSGDTVVFIATADGTPQAYWATLSEPSQWTKISGCAGGVWNISVIQKSRKAELVASVLNKGNIRLCPVGLPPASARLMTTDSSDTSGAADADSAFPDSEKVVGQPDTSPLATRLIPNTDSIYRWKYNPVPTNGTILAQFPSIQGGIKGEHYLVGDTTEETARSLWVGSGLRLCSPWEEIEGGAQGTLAYHIGQKYVRDFDPALNIWAKCLLWHFSLQGLFDFRKTSAEIPFEGYHMERRSRWYEAGARLSYQTGMYSGISCNLSKEWLDDNIVYMVNNLASYHEGYSMLTYTFPKVYQKTSITMHWNYQHSIPQMDPARLGNTLLSCDAEIEAAGNRYSLRAQSNIDTFYYLDTLEYMDGGLKFIRPRLDMEKRVLFRNQKFGLRAAVHGFYSIADMSPGKKALYFAEYLGGEEMLSGYSPAYFPARSLAVISGEMRFNPFVRLVNDTRLYERFSLGLCAEAGVAEYVIQGDPPVFPASVEAAMRYFFPLQDVWECFWYAKIGVPLTRLEPEKDPDFCQLYFGFTIANQ